MLVDCATSRSWGFIHTRGSQASCAVVAVGAAVALVSNINGPILGRAVPAMVVANHHGHRPKVRFERTAGFAGAELWIQAITIGSAAAFSLRHRQGEGTMVLPLPQDRREVELAEVQRALRGAQSHRKPPAAHTVDARDVHAGAPLLLVVLASAQRPRRCHNSERGARDLDPVPAQAAEKDLSLLQGAEAPDGCRWMRRFGLEVDVHNVAPPQDPPQGAQLAPSRQLLCAAARD
mmetsp:Transcript_31591/g.87134  ORF Transcript_31591/g.87134 Transcript_31591/m.87134 type:complete len:234 (+) Transcript_31591:248-949(+)